MLEHVLFLQSEIKSSTVGNRPGSKKHHKNELGFYLNNINLIKSYSFINEYT
jgi:hypothetical protein